MKTQNSKLKTQNFLTAVIIAKNEEKNIKECLESVSWADEIIVVDSGSTDDTVNIAKKFPARVVSFGEGGSYSNWRNKGTQEANGEWILFVDADERVTRELEEEIKSTVHGLQSTKKAYAIPRRNILLGHEMKHGGWWPDYVLRLMKKDSLIRWKGELHEQPEIRGKIGKLKNPLIHITHRDLSSMIGKTNKWSEIEARLLFESNHPKMNIPRFLSAMFREFWYRAIKEEGFLDGTIGWVEIIYQVFSKAVTYTKLWEKQLGSGKLKAES